MLNVSSQFKHRVARLYPPYMAVLLVALLIAFVKDFPYDFIAHLLSAQNILWMVTDYKSPMQPLTAHTWTLSIEVWTGLAWLFLLKFSSKEWFRKIMFVMLAIGAAYRTITIACGASAFVVSLCPIAHFDAFACGSILAVLFKEREINMKICSLVVIGIVGIVTSIMFIAANNHISFVGAYDLLSSSKNYLNNYFTGNIYLFISLLTMGLVGVLILVDERNSNKIMNRFWKLFVTLGNSSYALYLFHWPIMVILKRFVGRGWLLFLMTLFMSFLACYIFEKFFYLIEAKILRKNLA